MRGQAECARTEGLTRVVGVRFRACDGESLRELAETRSQSVSQLLRALVSTALDQARGALPQTTSRRDEEVS